MSDEDKPPQTGRLLSGDFDSPAAVLASDLDQDDKVVILQTWKKEMKRSNDEGAEDLLNQVNEALKTFDHA